MKKFILLLSLLFPVVISSGQNYQMVYQDSESLFSFPNGEITGIRIDSISTDTIFYPNSNIAFDWVCASPYGNNLAGNKIVIKENGDHLLFNRYGDTILIKTEATAGVTWTAFNTETRHVTASVATVQLESFLGFSDTVKTISFTCFDAEHNPVECPLNSLNLKVSRSYGIIQAIPMKYFPDLEIASLYSLDMSELPLEGYRRGSEQYGIRNLTWFEVHDFNIGDELHVATENSSWEYANTFIGYIHQEKFKLKYIQRTDYKDSIIYRIAREGRQYSTTTDSDTAYSINDTITETIRKNTNFDKQPNETIIENKSVSYWEASFTTVYLSDPDSKITHIGDGTIIKDGNTNDSCWYGIIYDGCNFPGKYRRGLGGPYGYCQNWNSWGGQSISLRYYKKGDETWGTPMDFVSAGKRSIETTIRVYPNPALDMVNIQSDIKSIDQLLLYNVSGQLILKKDVGTRVTTLDLGQVKSGLYILMIHTGNTWSRKKLVVE